ncbi:glutathione S-transferase family protein [Prosthecodimorpha staleyi]|uniref:Glutathione S-transferase family protein n=1 Tax=Prosthecodimorpha staleyi TaxID=2840188 RepID=A0A947GGI6_9HYPH|nr:glutathione S-transferase family protein [Prosthecodimorpha staleyi]MBT9292295.1 glutathione S-transferase family protein [Prosthecodimorpha staleyi]
MRLVIANKLYSSWSLRPWLVAAHFGIPFEELVIPLDQPDTHARILEHSPSGRVPCLIDGDLHVWESLAIIEYLAETFPDHAIWPRDREARALARSISNEMHAGFQGLRKACPMNLRRDFAWRDFGREASENAVRIVELWRDARRRHGAAGPFLFGAFSAADAMYAPVVIRFNGYNWPVEPDIRAYMDAVLTLPAFESWLSAARKETWIVPSDEIEPV